MGPGHGGGGEARVPGVSSSRLFRPLLRSLASFAPSCALSGVRPPLGGESLAAGESKLGRAVPPLPPSSPLPVPCPGAGRAGRRGARDLPLRSFPLSPLPLSVLPLVSPAPAPPLDARAPVPAPLPRSVETTRPRAPRDGRHAIRARRSARAQRSRPRAAAAAAAASGRAPPHGHAPPRALSLQPRPPPVPQKTLVRTKAQALVRVSAETAVISTPSSSNSV